jgi:hypothetical protein
VQAKFGLSSTLVIAAILIKPAMATVLVFLMLVSGPAFFFRALVSGALIGLLSVAALGWPIHASFIDLMRASGQVTYEWYYNSSLFILLENGRQALGEAGQSEGVARAVNVATAAIQAGALLGLLALAVAGRQRLTLRPARRHFEFLLAICLFLLASRTLWEHYLELLFIPLIFVVSRRDRFSPGAIRIVGAIFLLCVFQNYILISFLRNAVAFDSAPALVAIALFKSGPLILTAIFLWRHWRELIDAHAEWPAVVLTGRAS